MHKFSTAVLALIISAAWLSFGAAAQVNDIITTIEHRFGESVRFQAEIEAETPVASAVIYFQVESDARTNMGLAKIIKIDQNRYQAVYEHKVSDYAIAPFSTVFTYWEIYLTDGSVIKSPINSYPYIDNRFIWSDLEQDGIHVFWHQGGSQFGDILSSVVSQAIFAIQEYLPGAQIEGLEIYVYPDDETMPTAMNTNSMDGIVGPAAPESGVVMVALPVSAEQQSLAQQRIPHVLMHFLVYQYAKEGYTSLPVWLKEGLASAVESNSNPGYLAVLKKSSDNHRLLPIRSFCSSLPLDADENLLSYAQAQSFSRYLHNTYGTTGIVSLIGAYSQGMGCEEGFKKALGFSLSQAEEDWKRGLFQNEAQKGLEKLLPWVAILLAVLAAPIAAVIQIVFRHGKTEQK